MNLSEWGLPEWGTIAAAGYFVMSLIGDAKRGVRGARKTVRRLRSKKK